MPGGKGKYCGLRVEARRDRMADTYCMDVRGLERGRGRSCGREGERVDGEMGRGEIVLRFGMGVELGLVMYCDGSGDLDPSENRVRG